MGMRRSQQRSNAIAAAKPRICFRCALTPHETKRRNWKGPMWKRCTADFGQTSCRFRLKCSTHVTHAMNVIWPSIPWESKHHHVTKIRSYRGILVGDHQAINLPTVINRQWVVHSLDDLFDEVCRPFSSDVGGDPFRTRIDD